MRFTGSSLPIAGIAILALVAACGGSSDGDSPTARATVDAAGGTVASADGRVVLTIPAGALGNATDIRITEIAASQQPAAVRAVAPMRVYRLEPSGTQFAVPARLRIALPSSPSGEIPMLGLHSNGTIEPTANMSIELGPTGRAVSGDVPHFSDALVRNAASVRVTLTTSATTATVGSEILASFTLTKAADAETYDFEPDGFRSSEETFYVGTPAPELSVDTGTALADTNLAPFVQRTLTDARSARCSAVGEGYVVFYGDLRDYVFFGVLANPFPPPIEFVASQRITCTPAPTPNGVVAVGVFTAGITAPDGINLITGGNFANLPGTGPFGVVSGGSGVKVIDFVTRQVVLDRTEAGPDGATVGTNLIGAAAAARAASAGSTATLVGYGNGGTATQQWTAANGWGGTFLGLASTFDIATAGGGSVATALVQTAPGRGVDVIEYDAANDAYRGNPAKFTPVSAFADAGQLVSAQLTADHATVLVLSRASGASTGSKLFALPAGTTAASPPLLSFAGADARRLRCLPVAGKQVCIATLFGGEAKVFAFDPAAPATAPAVTTLPMAAGALGAAVAARSNGRVVFAVANFTANTVNVFDATADLSTFFENTSFAVPSGCTNPAQVAIYEDLDGPKVITTCNGSGSYWVLKPFS